MYDYKSHLRVFRYRKDCMAFDGKIEYEVTITATIPKDKIFLIFPIKLSSQHLQI